MRELTELELEVWIESAANSAQKLKDGFAAKEIYVANVATSFVPFSHLTKALQVHEAVLVLVRMTKQVAHNAPCVQMASTALMRI